MSSVITDQPLPSANQEEMEILEDEKKKVEEVKKRVEEEKNKVEEGLNIDPEDVVDVCCVPQLWWVGEGTDSCFTSMANCLSGCCEDSGERNNENNDDCLMCCCGDTSETNNDNSGDCLTGCCGDSGGANNLSSNDDECDCNCCDFD